MNMRVPDHHLHDAKQDESPTPEQELDDGNVAACDAFYKWLTDPVNEVELYDFVMGQADSVVMRSLIKRWSEKVQGGGMSDWIKTSEDLPKDKRDYQLYCEDTEKQFVGFYHGNGKFQFGRYNDSVADVQLLCIPSHWSEKPEPPK